jgi:hypothetical protein
MRVSLDPSMKSAVWRLKCSTTGSRNKYQRISHQILS